MSNKQGKYWFRFGWHPAEEELLLFLDGEASERQSDKVRAHLESCWACRSQRDKLDRAIATFMDYCEAEATDASTLPPRATAQFAERLRVAASTQPKPSLITRWGNALRGPFAERRLAFVTTACLLLMAALTLIFLRAERPVSAQELLRRTTQAETLSLRRVGEPVVYRKLQVKRVGADEPVVWESWNDAQRQQFRQRVADKQGLRFLRTNETATPTILIELEQIFRANHFDLQRPLSAAAFAAWRKAIQTKAETVSATKEGLRLTTTQQEPYSVNTITEASLIVRQSDWHAVALHLKVQGENEIRAYELRETAYEVLPLQALTVFADLAPAPLATSSPLASPTTSPTIVAALSVASASPSVTPTVALPSAAALQEAEVAALFTLHQLKADLGEQIEVLRDAKRQIIVHGLVETEVRKQQLNEALRAVPLVIPNLQTVEEAAQKIAVNPPAETVENHTIAAPQISASSPNANANPFQQYLEKYFIERGNDRRNAAMKTAQLSDAVVSEAATALSEAWALRRLAERFKPEQEDEFTAINRQRITEMMRNHLVRLQAQRRSLRTQLDPILSALAGTIAAPAANSVGNQQAQALQLFQAVEQFAQLSNSLFAGTGSGAPEQAARRVLAALAQWDGALQSLEQTMSK